jgi:solute carrier family 35 (adenosine 3'-phospho 5'-phosphosulfate transporter), member B2
MAFCFIGLQVSYLTWGVMQERIMTTKMEPTPLVPDGLFPSATFCVFSNRFLAIIVAAITCIRLYGTVETPAPLWSVRSTLSTCLSHADAVSSVLCRYYSPCALSNTLSSWAQYASLKYVSFPLQTLFKSAKVIPVMLMGKFLNNAKYSFLDYAEAIAITSGVAIFGLSKEKSPHASGSSFVRNCNFREKALTISNCVC